MSVLGTVVGRGVAVADGLEPIWVEYQIETRLKPGGFKVTSGWIGASEALLQGLVPAAEVFLELQDGERFRIELTEVADGRAYVRVPGRHPV